MPSLIRNIKSTCQARLLFGILCLLPTSVFSACWEIATPENIIVATNLWQVKNSHNDQATLMGKSAGENRVVPVEMISSLRKTNNIQSGWLSGNRNAVELEIHLIDNKKISLVSEMNLYYVIDNKRYTVAIQEIISAKRCAEDFTIANSPTENSKQTPSSPVLVMKNGDILYGEIIDDQLGWKTAYAVIAYQPTELRMIRTDCETPSTGRLETTAGDVINGSFISDDTIRFQLTTGQVIDIPLEQIKMIDFTNRQATDHMSNETCTQQERL